SDVCSSDLERRQAYQRLAKQRDPPGQRVPPDLLHLRLIEWELCVLVGKRAHVRPGADDRLAREAARIGAEAAAANSRLPTQRAPVKGDRRPQSSFQSKRISCEMDRMSCRISSCV